MAAPHAAGVAALFLERRPTASPAQVADAIRDNATSGRLSLEDVDQDGRADLVLHFSIPSLVQNGDLNDRTTRLFLGGEMLDAWPVHGSDGVRIVP